MVIFLYPLWSKLWKELSCSGLWNHWAQYFPYSVSAQGWGLLCRKKYQPGNCSTLHSAVSLFAETANESGCSQPPKSCGFGGVGTCPVESAMKPPTYFIGSSKDQQNTNNIQSLLTKADFGPDAWSEILPTGWAAPAASQLHIVVFEANKTELFIISRGFLWKLLQPQLSLETSHTAYFIFFNDFINIYLVTNSFIHMILLYF